MMITNSNFTSENETGDLQALKFRILEGLQGERKKWAETINQIIADNNYSKGQFARLCQVSRPAVNKWCSGSLPKTRDAYIRIGFAAHYSLEEINELLQRRGKYPALYAKSLEDSVCAFILNSNDFPHTYECYRNTLATVSAAIISENDSKVELEGTLRMNNALQHLQSIEELIRFVNSHTAEYRNAYQKFYAYVDRFLVLNTVAFRDDGVSSVNSIATAQGWSSSLRQCTLAIRKREWFPLRRKVIALGIHLNMTTSQINEMLQLAQMQRLYAENPVECAIIYAMRAAEKEGLICPDGRSDLCDRVRTVLEELEIEDTDELLNDLTDKYDLLPPTPDKKLTLCVQERGKSTLYTLNDWERWKIGRETPNHKPQIPVKSIFAGLTHGEFYALNDAWYYTDCGSKYGTFYNETKIKNVRNMRSIGKRMETGKKLQINPGDSRHPDAVTIYVTVE